MNKPGKILLQTTIPFTPDNWHIGRFSLLRECLAGLSGDDGEPLFAVTARDREPLGKPDSVLSTVDHSDFAELWLFAIDAGQCPDGVAARFGQYAVELARIVRCHTVSRSSLMRRTVRSS